MNLARGCGAMTIAFRPFTALMLLITGVASGLVEGDRGPNHANRLADFDDITLDVLLDYTTDLSGRISISAARVFTDILRICRCSHRAGSHRGFVAQDPRLHRVARKTTPLL